MMVKIKFRAPLVNAPDYQWRIFKRDYPRISFTRRLHEKIEGYGASVALPKDEEWAIYHDKTIETQIKTNQRYNQMFTRDENLGHNVFDGKKITTEHVKWDKKKRNVPKIGEMLAFNRNLDFDIGRDLYGEVVDVKHVEGDNYIVSIVPKG